MATIGELVAYWRDRKDMSQEALAEAIGVSRPAVSQWETGETDPTGKNLAALVAAFGITRAQFFAAERAAKTFAARAASRD